MENPYRGFVPVCICALSIALRFRSCKRGQGNFSHFGWYDKFLRQNWAKWRKNTSPEGVFKEGETIFRGTSFFSNGGQRPPPPFAALRQRRDLIIANPRVRVSKGEGAHALPLWSFQGEGIFKGRGKSKSHLFPPAAAGGTPRARRRGTPRRPQPPDKTRGGGTPTKHPAAAGRAAPPRGSAGGDRAAGRAGRVGGRDTGDRAQRGRSGEQPGATWRPARGSGDPPERARPAGAPAGAECG